MNKRLFAMILALVCLMNAGCSLASEDVGDHVPETAEDQLVGVLITLDEYEPSGKENGLPYWNPETTGLADPLHCASNEGARLYAEPVTQEFEEDGESWSTTTYQFPEGSGIACMMFLVMQDDVEEHHYWSSELGEGINDAGRFISASDEGTALELVANLYVDENAVDLAIYLNPVYQTTEGEVYALGTAPMGYHAVSMSGCSETISQTVVTTLGDRTIKSADITLTIQTVSLPEKYVILEMDGDNQVVSRTEYAPEEMPEWLTTQMNTAYLVVESHSGDTVERAVYSRDDENVQIESFYPAELGICIKGYTWINWGY